MVHNKRNKERKHLCESTQDFLGVGKEEMKIFSQGEWRQEFRGPGQGSIDMVRMA